MGEWAVGILPARVGVTMKAIIYLAGTAILVAGVLFGMHTAGVGEAWILTTGLIFGGLGIMGAAKEHISGRKVTRKESDSSGNTKTTETEVQAG